MERDIKIIAEINQENEYPNYSQMLIHFKDTNTLHDFISKKNKR